MNSYLETLNSCFETKCYEGDFETYEKFIEVGIPSIIYKEHVILEKITEEYSIKHVLLIEDGALRFANWCPPISELPSSELPSERGQLSIKLMHPFDAMKNGINYESDYICTITEFEISTNLKDGCETKTKINGPLYDVVIAKIPIMVKSKFCNLTIYPKMASNYDPNDKGGYFIINRKK